MKTSLVARRPCIGLDAAGGTRETVLRRAVIAQMRTRVGAPVVLAGDLNLPGGSSDLESCAPAGSALADDDGVQHVVGTPEFLVESAHTMDLHGASDHPALLVTLAFQPNGATPLRASWVGCAGGWLPGRFTAGTPSVRCCGPVCACSAGYGKLM